jgi:4'-phosphopantetheinyl transferase EntD
MTRPALNDGDIEALFAVPVHACVASPEMWHAPLAAGEAEHVARATPQRRGEFAAGRAAARNALARLGLHDVALPPQQDRSPLWPAGHVGSISHCEGFCAAVAATRKEASSLGFDAEPAQPLPEEVKELVCGPADHQAAGTRLQADPLWPTIVFSAKEAAYKAQFPLSREVLGFEAAVVLPDGSCDERGGTFRVRFGPGAPCHLHHLAFQGVWRLLAGLVLTAVWLPATPERLARTSDRRTVDPWPRAIPTLSSATWRSP